MLTQVNWGSFKQQQKENEKRLEMLHTGKYWIFNLKPVITEKRVIIKYQGSKYVPVMCILKSWQVVRFDTFGLIDKTV